MAGVESETCPNIMDLPPFTIPADWFAAHRPRAAIVVLPAMGTPAQRYRVLAECLQARCFSVLLAELPGTGASEPKPSRTVDYGYGDLVGRYLPGLVAAARERAPGSPVLALGHSLGGQVAALGAAHGGADLDVVVTVASGHIHYRNWQGAGAAKVRFAAFLFPFLARLFGHLPGRRLGFGGPQARTLIGEWSRTIRTGGFPDFARASPNPACPALCIGYEGDFLAPMRSVAGLAGLLDGATLKLPVNWPGPPHSAWTRYPDSTVSAIENWLVRKNLVAGT